MVQKFIKSVVTGFLALWMGVSFVAAAQASEVPPILAHVRVEGSKFTASQKIAVQVSVMIGSEELCEDQLALSYHIYRPNGDLLLFEGARINLKDWVNGEITNIPVAISLDSLPGLFEEKELDIEFDIVNETVGYWFSTSPGVELTTDRIQYRGHFIDKAKECALRALQHPISILVNAVLWIAVFSTILTISRGKKVPRFSGPFYGQFDPPVDKVIYESFFKKRPLLGKGVFIECGAFDGVTECSCKFFEESLGWHGINVEPSPPIFKKLEKNRPGSVNVNAALSDVSGEAEFHGVVHPTFGELCINGSLEHTDNHKKVLEEMGCSIKNYTVPVITYEELIRKNHIKRCDLFVLDVEGNELKVIKSMKQYGKVLPKIFVVEHGQIGQEAIISAVEPMGYTLCKESFVNSFFVRRRAIERLFMKFLTSTERHKR